MSTTIPTAFIDAFSAETKLAYQRMGAKLRPAVRTVTNIGASTYRFPTLGKGVANTKGRAADVTPMNLLHGNATATLVDRYAPEYADNLDLFKTNQDVRRDYAESAAAAIGRAEDELITTAWNAAPGDTVVHAGVSLTKDKILEAAEILNTNDVPMDASERFFIIGPSQNTGLLSIEEAVRIDFATGKMLVDGKPTNTWMGFTWIVHTGLPVVSSGPTIRNCFAVHRRAAGLAIGKDVASSIDWVAQKQSYLVLACMSMGAVAIDSDGIVAIECQE
jgi:hypothetical protein